MADESVLIIDPDVSSRRFIEAMLAKQNYKIFACSGAKEGLIMAWREQPSAIIFEAGITDLPALELMKKIRQDRRTANTPTVVIAAQPRPDQMAALLSAGCNEYLPKNAQTVPTLLELLPRLLKGVVTETSVPAKKGGFLVVFLSAKGGTGTSSLCANLANIVATATKASVAVVDMVLPIGSIDTIVGLNNSTNIVDLAEKSIDQITPEVLAKLPVPNNWKFHLLSSAPDPERANALQVGRLPELLKVLKETYDFVFVDLGRSLSRISLPIINSADVVTVIVATEISAVAVTKTVWNYLQLQGVDAQRVYMILNRAVGLEGLSKGEAERVIGLQIQAAMPYMMGNFVLANNQHVPVISKFPNDTAALMMKQMSSDIATLAQKMRTS